MTGVSQAENQRTWRRRSWQCEERHAWHFKGSKWVYGSTALRMCVDSRFRKTKQNKTKQAKNKQTLEKNTDPRGTDGQSLVRSPGRSQGRAPEDNRCPASPLAMQNDSWLFQLPKRSLPWIAALSQQVQSLRFAVSTAGCLSVLATIQIYWCLVNIYYRCFPTMQRLER